MYKPPCSKFYTGMLFSYKVDSKTNFTEIINTGTDLVIKNIKRYKLDIIKFDMISRSKHQLVCV